MKESIFFKKAVTTYAGDEKPCYTVYLPMQTEYHTYLNPYIFINGSWDIYMKDQMKSSYSSNEFCTTEKEALNYVNNKHNLKPGTAFLIRFILPIKEIGEQIANGNFSKVIFDIVSCEDLLAHSEKPRVITNPNYDPNFGKAVSDDESFDQTTELRS